MSVKIIEINPSRLVDYGRIPCRLIVKSILRVELIDHGLGGLLLREVPVEESYIKDYDAYGEIPTDWPNKFDVTKWGFFLAIQGGEPVGAATVAFGSSEVSMLEARPDLAVLWDIRSQPTCRGVGIPLFRRAIGWSNRRGCRQMKIETQNINVPACRFYQRMGCQLGEIRRFGYAAVPAVAHEVMLNWYYTLGTQVVK